MRELLKVICNSIALVITMPLAATSWLESRTSRTEGIFLLWAQLLALIPSLAGVYIRRAYYRLTLESCSLECFIGFGTFLTHRDARIEANVYIGHYSMIGCAWLKEGCLIGSRTSLLSGTRLHHRSEDGQWSPAVLELAQQIVIHPHTWIGEGAVVMTDVGRGAMVAAGAVVATPVPDNVMVAGNPARFVQKLPDVTSNPNARTTENEDSPLPDKAVE